MVETFRGAVQQGFTPQAGGQGGVPTDWKGRNFVIKSQDYFLNTCGDIPCSLVHHGNTGNQVKIYQENPYKEIVRHIRPMTRNCR